MSEKVDDGRHTGDRLSVIVLMSPFWPVELDLLCYFVLR